MKIHIKSKQKYTPPQSGDRKVVKGVLCERVMRKANIGTKNAPFWADDCTGGKQNYDWKPVVDIKE